jgi:misacylated tRNA(Ala) deacylase
VETPLFTAGRPVSQDMPETELLYMKDIEANYIREFDARVLEKGPGWAVLDRTAFYPLGGGQPSDTGTLIFAGGQVRVREVTKKGAVRHLVDEEMPPAAETVRGAIDWAPRHAHMRMHTAQHILSGVVFDLFKARTVGNQIHADHSRIDFAPVVFTDQMVAEVEKTVNGILARDIPVTIGEEDRSEIELRVCTERANLDLLPKSVHRLRIVKIGDIDECPCAGTHVRNTSEIGLMKITRRENKGKDRERITYILEK